MGTSPEAVVRSFLGTWGDPSAHRLASFFKAGGVDVER